MGDCGGGCMMLWRNGRRFYEVLFRDRCMSVINDHQTWKIGTKVSRLILADQRESESLRVINL